MKTIAAALCALIAPILALAAAPARAEPEKPVEVMIVGAFHMSNPGQDMANAKYEDVLTPRHQAEIEKAVDALARFQPTRVAVEWPAEVAAERYARYRAGTLPTSRNEVVQLGFRLAAKAGLESVQGADADGDFPFEPVAAYAAAHGRQAVIDQGMAEAQAFVKAQEQVFAKDGAAALLAWINQPERIARSHDFYRRILLVGGGAEQPGADLMTAWYRRNFLICANILQPAKPGDRIVVLYGAGHAFLLRQCVAETPGFRLVEPSAWLPK